MDILNALFPYFYGLLALLGLGVLIFFHELGHYWVARRVGMKVEVFSIGFGRPLRVWYRDDVKWQICWLPFGGYVKLAGMESREDMEDHEVEGGFWSKGPWDRIKVLFAGPGANFLLAIIVFTGLWLAGGREKSFHELTHYVGWVDTKSPLYEEGVRPGDRIIAYDGHPFRGYRDHLYGAMLDTETTVQGEHVHLLTGAVEPFQVDVKPYMLEGLGGRHLPSLGIRESANYLIFSQDAGGFLKHSPLRDHGLQPGDRIVWANGQVVASLYHLNQILNGDQIVATVDRGGKILQIEVPRVAVRDLQLQEEDLAELSDWQYAAGLKDQKLQNLDFIPYNIDANGVVEAPFTLLKGAFNPTLQPGDRLVALQGMTVADGPQVLENCQHHWVHLMVQRGNLYGGVVPFLHAEQDFYGKIPLEDLRALASTFGTSSSIQKSGSLVLLDPVEPITRKTFFMGLKGEADFQKLYTEQQQRLAAIEDPDLRRAALEALKESQKEWILGIPLQDKKVLYNPYPHRLFMDVMEETVRTFGGLLSGNLGLNMMSGPVGIIQVIQVQWSIGIKEVLFWLAFISVNLAFINLLPIPVLDGGYILLSLVEAVTGRKLKAKTVERLVFPFAILLILLFVYLTVNDLSRIFGGFWKW